MSLVSLPGQLASLIGPNPLTAGLISPNTLINITMDAANEAAIMIGQVVWADGGTHTIDTTGSSAFVWKTSTVTFANAGTTLKVGIAPVDTSNGPPGRAVNVSDVISFDVAAVFAGGGGGVTTNASQNSVPTTGTKTIADGDLVAFCIQMTARGGADSVLATTLSIGNAALDLPIVTEFTGGAYAVDNASPNAILIASDGTIGYFYGGANFNSLTVKAFSNVSSPNEHGQLYQLPFPITIYGIYGWVSATADFTVNLYSDPLGTPVSRGSFAFDANWVSSSSGKRFMAKFAPYTVPANTPVAAVLTPNSGTNITAYFKTLADARYRIADPWGLSGYGVDRSGGSGAFANANVSLDHYFIGLLVSGFANDAFNGYPASRMRLGM